MQRIFLQSNVAKHNIDIYLSLFSEQTSTSSKTLSRLAWKPKDIKTSKRLVNQSVASSSTPAQYLLSRSRKSKTGEDGQGSITQIHITYIKIKPASYNLHACTYADKHALNTHFDFCYTYKYTQVGIQFNTQTNVYYITIHDPNQINC